MQELIGNQLGPYQIVSRVGSGGMTVVYKAYQPNLDRYVALKVLLPQYIEEPIVLERFFQEIQIIARLEHPHIVPMYDYGQSEGYFYMVMRLVESGSLFDRFHGQPFALSQIHKIITQVGDALDYAHSQGIVHRDIKMKNILMDARDNALLTDFGIAKVLQSDARLTQVGRTLGTPTHMAPEQIQGDPVDGRTDIYALGVLLFQLATGRTPYQADSSHEIIMMHLYNPLPSARVLNPALPEALDQVIITALAKMPADRYATAGEMVRAVQAATFDKTTTLVDEELSTTLPSLAVTLPPPLAIEETEKTIHLPLPQVVEPAREPDHLPEDSTPSASQARPEVQPSGQQGKLSLLFGSVIIVLLLAIIGLILYFGPQIQTSLVSQQTSPATAISGVVVVTPSPVLVSPLATGETLPAGFTWEQLLDQPETIRVGEAHESNGVVFGGVYQNFILEAEMTQLGGDADNSYGVTFRENESGDSYYSFEIGQDGFWGFYKISNCSTPDYTDCDIHLIRGGETGAIHEQGPQILQVEALGPNFTFQVNGEKIEGVTDTNFSKGYNGLIVAAGETGGAEVKFERFKIASLE